jgi:hypothetical protein
MQNEIREEPFFARFLEGQEYPEVQSDLRAGRVGQPIHSWRYPSVDDEVGTVV